MICKECLIIRDNEYAYNKDFCTLRCKQQWELFQTPFGTKWISVREVDEDGNDTRLVHPLKPLSDRLKLFK